VLSQAVNLARIRIGRALFPDEEGLAGAGRRP
jgi:hypothetical protein